MTEPRITVVTPTFNRQALIHRVYNSLATQTYPHFEWLVIDDGSTDGTCGQVSEWARRASFPIHYAYQENRGKHFACNRAIDMAQGDFFIIADSDDEFVPESLQTLVDLWNSIPENKRSGFCGVTARCRTQTGAFVGTTLPQEILDSDNLELHYRYHVNGEKWGMIRMDIMRQFRFAETPVVGPFPWGRIAAAGYKTRYSEKVIRIYYVDDQQTDSISKVVSVRQPMVNVYVNTETLNVALRWFWSHPTEFLKIALNLCRFGRAAGVKLGSLTAPLNSAAARWLVRLAYWPSIFFPVKKL